MKKLNFFKLFFWSEKIPIQNLKNFVHNKKNV